MLDTLISSKTRIKLLLKFFLNSQAEGYLRGLEAEFQESTNSIRLELNRLEGAALLTSYKKNNKKMFRANTEHPLYQDIHSIVSKLVGLDKIYEDILCRINALEEAYITGNLASGINSGVIGLCLVGEHLDRAEISTLVDEAENHIKRKIQFMVVEEHDREQVLNGSACMRIWPCENLKSNI